MFAPVLPERNRENDPMHHAQLATRRQLRALKRPHPTRSAPRARITMSLPDALAHELNNPLSIALLEAGALRAAGQDVDSLVYALQRIQAVGAELRLPGRVAQIASERLEVTQAFEIVHDLLGCQGRLDIKLPRAVIDLEPLPLCHLLHAMLVAHLDTNSKSRVVVRAERRRGRLRVSITGGERSERVRTSLLAVGLNEAGESDAEPCHELSRRAALALGVGCSLDSKPGQVKSSFELPLLPDVSPP